MPRRPRQPSASRQRRRVGDPRQPPLPALQLPCQVWAENERGGERYWAQFFPCLSAESYSRGESQHAQSSHSAHAKLASKAVSLPPSLADAEKLQRCKWEEPAVKAKESDVIDGLLFESMELGNVDRAKAAISTDVRSEDAATVVLTLPSNDGSNPAIIFAASKTGFLPLQVFEAHAQL